MMAILIGLPGWNMPDRLEPGCYDVAMGAWEPHEENGGDSLFLALPSRVQVVEASDSGGTLIVPEAALPSVHTYMSWNAAPDTTVVLSFSTGEVGVAATVSPLGEGWRGTAESVWDTHRPGQTASIALTNVPCGTEPKVRRSEQRYVPEALLLESGLELKLGQSYDPPESWVGRPDRFTRYSRGPETVSGIGEADRLRMSPTFSGSHLRVVSAEFSVVGFGELRTRLHDWLGTPSDAEPLSATASGEYESVAWRNRERSLVLMRSRTPEGEWAVQVLFTAWRLEFLSGGAS